MLGVVRVRVDPRRYSLAALLPSQKGTGTVGTVSYHCNWGKLHKKGELQIFDCYTKVLRRHLAQTAAAGVQKNSDLNLFSPVNM